MASQARVEWSGRSGETGTVGATAKPELSAAGGSARRSTGLPRRHPRQSFQIEQPVVIGVAEPSDAEMIGVSAIESA